MAGIYSPGVRSCLLLSIYPSNAVALRICKSQGMTPRSGQAEKHGQSAPNGPVLDADVCQLYASAAQRWWPAASRIRTSLCLQGASLLRHLKSHSSRRLVLLQTPCRPGCSRQCARGLMAPLRIHRQDLPALRSEGHRLLCALLWKTLVKAGAASGPNVLTP